MPGSAPATAAMSRYSTDHDFRMREDQAGCEQRQAGDGVPAVVVHPQHLGGRRVGSRRKTWFDDEPDHRLDDVKRSDDQQADLGETPLHGAPPCVIR